MPGCQFSMEHCKLQNTVLESKIDLFVLIKEKRYLVLNNHDRDGKAKKKNRHCICVTWLWQSIYKSRAVLRCWSLWTSNKTKKRKPINNIQCTHLIRDEHTFNNLFCFSCLMEKSVLDKNKLFWRNPVTNLDEGVKAGLSRSSYLFLLQNQDGRK